MTDHNNAPRDAVPPPPPSRDEILQWNALVATAATISEPGEVISTDGVPIGVGPTTTTRATIGALTVYQDQLDAVGLTADDVRNLTIRDR